MCWWRWRQAALLPVLIRAFSLSSWGRYASTNHLFCTIKRRNMEARRVIWSMVTPGRGRPLSVLMFWAQLRVLMRVSVWGGLPRSWPINSFEVFAVWVLLLWLQGLRVLQQVFIPLILRLDVWADGGGALALKAPRQSCRVIEGEKRGR